MTANTLALPPEHQERLRALMAAKGIARSAQILGVCRHSLERAAGGLTVLRATAAMIAQKIAARDAAGKTP
jgi:hypothetical protein